MTEPSETPSPEAPSPELMAILRRLHRPGTVVSDYCGHDSEDWPCDAARLLAEVDRLRARITELEAALAPFAHSWHPSFDDIIGRAFISLRQNNTDPSEERAIEYADLKRAATVYAATEPKEPTDAD